MAERRAEHRPDAAIDEILRGYGIEAPSDAGNLPTAPIVVRRPDEIGDILRGYGVTLKPADRAQIKKGAPQPDPADLSQASPGKLLPVPEYPPNEADIARAEKRGLKSQFVSGIPVVGPAVDLATAAIPERPGDQRSYAQRLYDQRQADR